MGEEDLTLGALNVNTIGIDDGCTSCVTSESDKQVLVASLSDVSGPSVVSSIGGDGILDGKSIIGVTVVCGNINERSWVVWEILNRYASWIAYGVGIGSKSGESGNFRER